MEIDGCRIEDGVDSFCCLDIRDTASVEFEDALTTSQTPLRGWTVGEHAKQTCIVVRHELVAETETLVLTRTEVLRV